MQEALLIVVGYEVHAGDSPTRFVLQGKVSADMAVDVLPDPPITREEMQAVAYAAKLALAKVLRKRKRAK